MCTEKYVKNVWVYIMNVFARKECICKYVNMSVRKSVRVCACVCEKHGLVNSDSF